MILNNEEEKRISITNYSFIGKKHLNSICMTTAIEKFKFKFKKLN